MRQQGGRPNGGHASAPQRRIQKTITLAGLTLAESDWLLDIAPRVLGGSLATPDAVQVRGVALRYRPGRMGIADALDATEQLFAPLAAAGATIEPRHRWEILDDDDDGLPLTPNGTPRSFAEAMRLRQLRAKGLPDDVDLSVDAVMVVDAPADDGIAAMLFWLALALPSHDW